MFSYWFHGSKWSFEIYAASQAEALLRFDQLKSTAMYDGEVMMSIPAGPIGWVHVWWLKLKGTMQ